MTTTTEENYLKCLIDQANPVVHTKRSKCTKKKFLSKTYQLYAWWWDATNCRIVFVVCVSEATVSDKFWQQVITCTRFVCNELSGWQHGRDHWVISAIPKGAGINSRSWCQNLEKNIHWNVRCAEFVIFFFLFIPNYSILLFMHVQRFNTKTDSDQSTNSTNCLPLVQWYIYAYYMIYLFLHSPLSMADQCFHGEQWPP